MGEGHNIAVPDRRTPDDVRQPVGEASTVGKQCRLGIQAVTLPDGCSDREAWRFEIPVEAIGDAGAVLPPVVAREAVERE